MVDLERIKRFAWEKGCVSVPQIQKQFNLTYKQARDIVGKLVDMNVLKQKDDLNFKTTITKKREPKPKPKPSPTYASNNTSKSRSTSNASTTRNTSSTSNSTSKAKVVIEVGSSRISKAKQEEIDRDCFREKLQEYLEESKKYNAEKRTVLCRRDSMDCASTFNEFNRLTAQAQGILQDAFTKYPDTTRFDTYKLLRADEEELPKFSKEYMAYDLVLTFLLRSTDNGFEKLKKRLTA